MSGPYDDLRDVSRRQQAEIVYWREQAAAHDARATWAETELRASVRREIEACKQTAEVYRESAEFLREVSGRWIRAEGMVEGFRGMLAGREEMLRALPAPQPKRQPSALEQFVEGATFGIYRAPRE